jgi:hypothetical protein
MSELGERAAADVLRPLYSFDTLAGDQNDTL